MGESGPVARDRSGRQAASAADSAEARAQLVEGWIQPALGPVVVGFGGPDGGAGDEARVELTLLAVMPALAARATHGAEPLRLEARYLVTTAGGDGGDPERMIVELAFAALAAGRPELERDPPPAELWRALGVPARAALVARVRLERSRDLAPVPVVRTVVAEWSSTRAVTGRVIGPGDVPIAAARVEIERAGLTTFSDHRGAFRFAAVPAGPPLPTVAVAAKGTRLTLSVPSADEPLLIRLPLPEPSDA